MRQDITGDRGGKSRQGLKAGPEAETAGCLSLLPYTTQDHLLRSGSAHRELFPSHINHWSRKCPKDLPTSQSDGDIFSFEVPSLPGGSWLVLQKLPSAPPQAFVLLLSPSITQFPPHPGGWRSFFSCALKAATLIISSPPPPAPGFTTVVVTTVRCSLPSAMSGLGRQDLSRHALLVPGIVPGYRSLP